MATKTMTQHICDRCSKVYSETAPTDPKADPAAKQGGVVAPMLILEMASTNAVAGEKMSREVLQFDDLCPKCHSRCADLVKAMRLEKEDKDKDAEKTAPVPDEKSSPATAQAAAATKPDKALDGSTKPTDNKTKQDAKAQPKAP